MGLGLVLGLGLGLGSGSGLGLGVRQWGLCKLAPGLTLTPRVRVRAKLTVMLLGSGLGFKFGSQSGLLLELASCDVVPR